jgi:acetyl-CoA synthetase
MPEAAKDRNIDSTLIEKRLFKPAKAFQQQAHIKSLGQYQALYRKAQNNPESFWSALAKETLTWFKPWKKTLVWKVPFAQWFVGGQLNVSVNCLDRHLSTARRNKAALLWEGEPGDHRTLTYQEL